MFGNMCQLISLTRWQTEQRCQVEPSLLLRLDNSVHILNTLIRFPPSCHSSRLARQVQAFLHQSVPLDPPFFNHTSSCQKQNVRTIRVCVSSSAIAFVYHTDKRLSMDYLRRISVGFCDDCLRLGGLGFLRVFFLLVCNQIPIRIERKATKKRTHFETNKKNAVSLEVQWISCVCWFFYFCSRSLSLNLQSIVYSWTWR